MQTPSIPKGTRDFGQQDMAERNYIFDTIKSVFRTFGYAQIETPAMENLSTLLGKYGEEGDKLLFRIQNSGEKAALAPEKGLRYDLTVPFARYVVQHRSEISFPFKRFQIQPVWRADRPQKGRYREFYQCDVDVIGSRSQMNELELVQMVDRVFSLLDVRVLVKINNRKVLTGFAEICGFPDKVVDITVAIDKLDKIGLENVEAEMLEKGLTPAAVEVIRPILQLSGTTEEKLSRMRELMKGGSASGLVSETGLKGLDELEELFGLIGAAGVACPVEIDLSLARGLNYYTGAIFEVKAVTTTSPASSGFLTCREWASASAPTVSTTCSRGWTSSPRTCAAPHSCCWPTWARRRCATSCPWHRPCVLPVWASRFIPRRPNSRSSLNMPTASPSPSCPLRAPTRWKPAR